jgi:predicted AlkP superfamily pyrophosphatase or phosphodiesterase
MILRRSSHCRLLWMTLWVGSVACAGGSRAPAPVAAVPAVAAAPAPVRATLGFERVVIVSVDGLRPDDCARLPVMGELAREGAFAAPPEGALSVMPTVTYPAHTSMVTGVVPRRHGITTNSGPDPSADGKNVSGWRWFRSDVRVPTLYDAAFDAGLRTALLQWPVTVGARATALVPEFWIKGVEDDLKVVRLLSTPGLFDRLEQRYPGFSQRYVPNKVVDDAVIDAALAIIDPLWPQLMLVHIIEVDGASHQFGPDSTEADAARHSADSQLARLLAALRASPAWPNTVLVVVSDHGFLPVTKQVAPRVQLAARGLQDRVWMNSSGGSAYFYLQAPEDAEAAALTRSMFEELAADAANGIGTVLDRAAIADAGGDADAFLAIEALPGFIVSRDHSGPAVAAASAHARGTHGYLPLRPEMRATMLFYGPKIAPAVLHGARLIDLAPTVAGWLGLHLGETDGRPLTIDLRAEPAH